MQGMVDFHARAVNPSDTVRNGWISLRSVMRTWAAKICHRGCETTDLPPCSQEIMSQPKHKNRCLGRRAGPTPGWCCWRLVPSRSAHGSATRRRASHDSPCTSKLDHGGIDQMGTDGRCRFDGMHVAASPNAEDVPSTHAWKVATVLGRCPSRKGSCEKGWGCRR